MLYACALPLPLRSWTDLRSPRLPGGETFMSACARSQRAVLCADQPEIQAILPRVSRRVVTYGFSVAEHALDNMQEWHTAGRVVGSKF